MVELWLGWGFDNNMVLSKTLENEVKMTSNFLFQNVQTFGKVGRVDLSKLFCPY